MLHLISSKTSFIQNDKLTTSKDVCIGEPSSFCAQCLPLNQDEPHFYPFPVQGLLSPGKEYACVSSAWLEAQRLVYSSFLEGLGAPSGGASCHTTQMTPPQEEHYRCNSRCPPKPSMAFLCSGGVLQVLATEVTITSRFFSVAKNYHSKTIIGTVFEKPFLYLA